MKKTKKTASTGGTACRNHIVVLPGSEQENVAVRKACGHPAHSKNCCRNHMIVVPGTGKAAYTFPTGKELAAAACATIANAIRKAKSAGAKKGDLLASVKGMSDHATPIVPPNRVGAKGKKSLIATLPGVSNAGGSSTLFAAAEGLRVIFHNGRFDALVAEKFDPLTGAVAWAKKHMGEKYQPAITSLEEHLDQLQTVYRDALPRVMDYLAAQFPDASKDELLDAAVQTIDEQLAQILYVLRIWTDAFGQFRDGQYEQLQAVIYTVEQAYHLFRTGDINGVCDAECEKRLKSTVFGVKDVFVARFSGQGPATIPGTRGPVGAHAIEVPHDEKNIITLMLVLYLHEFRHDIFADVEGLEQEMTGVVAAALKKAHADKKFSFSTDTVQLNAKTKIPTIDLITKLFIDTIGEVDADISGGVLLSGPAFLYNMIPTFSAFNAKDEGVFNTTELLRSHSYYEVDEKGGLNFEVHLPDYIRVYSVAAALELLGFKAEADDCRLMADQASGAEVPTHIEWSDSEGKRKLVIRLSCEDLKQVLPVVADAIINTPLQSLGGVPMAKTVNWTPRRQKKVDALVTNLMAGNADVPTNAGDYFATYVAAAATLAYWGLVKSGVHPSIAATQVEVNALAMLDTIRQREAEKAAAAPKTVAPPATPKDGTPPAK
jgi:hypothetical protein